MLLPIYILENGKVFKPLPPPPRYRYSRGVDTTNGALYLGGGAMSYTTFGT